MTLDPGLLDPNAPADTSPTTGTAPGKPSVQDLGNGYSLVTWTDELGLPKSQIVPNKDAASVAAVEAAKIGAGAAGVSASITAGAANQRAAVQAEIDRARNAADAAHQQALDALAQGNAAEARRQFDISSSELQRYHTLDTGIRQQEANTSAQTAGYNIYKDLTDKASNPRNFMEQFFMHRGQPAPPNAGAYSNTPTGPQGIMPFEQFLPGFMRNLGLQGYGYGSPSPGAGAAVSPAASAPPPATAPNMTIPVGAGGAISDWARAHGYSAAGAASAAGVPSRAGQSMQNGNAIWTGGPYSGMRVDQTPSNAGDLTPYLQNPKLADPTGRVPPTMAQGGEVTMNAPHALVNLLTGRVAAIAGEAGKEHANFDGAAIIDPDKGIAPTPPVSAPGDPLASYLPPDPFLGTPYATGSSSNTAPAAAPIGPPTPDQFVPQTAPAIPSATGLNPITPSAQAAPTFTGLTPEQQAFIAAQTAAVAAKNAAAPPPSGPGVPPQFNPGAPGFSPQGPTPTPTPLLTSFTPPTNPVNVWGGPTMSPTGTGTGFGITDPGFGTPTWGSNTVESGTRSAVPSSTGNPYVITDPGFGTSAWASNTLESRARGGPLASTPSGIGTNPTFLPEDAAAKDPIIAAMLNAGSFPPFLQRLYAQAKGLPGLGTNVPQITNLPNDVPLISQLALNQMSPSEFQAFQSFLSAHGIDWNDYVSMVQAASPQGGTSRSTAIPKFLGQ